MHQELLRVSEHMRKFGLGLLSQAQLNTFFTSYELTYIDRGYFGVMQAAHSAEILIKACIAEKHPLLIFSKLPKSIKAKDDCSDLLDFTSLFESGRTVDYSDLPERLWAVTGYKVENIECFNSFGKFRNSLQHFSAPGKSVDYRQKSAEFIYEIIDPLINHFWGLYAVHYCDDEEPEYNLLPVLFTREIKFRYPDDMREYVEQARIEAERRRKDDAEFYAKYKSRDSE